MRMARPVVVEIMNDIVFQPKLDASPPARETGPCVLQVIPALNEGGAERGTVDVARHLVGRGWRAIVASAGGTLEGELEAAGALHVTLPLEAKSPFRIRRNIGLLQRVIREHGVDLVHARSRAPAWSAYYAARRARIPFVTTFHGVYDGSQHWLKRRYNAVMAKGARVIAVSDYVADHVRARYAVPNPRLKVIHRGVDLDRFNPLAVSEDRVQALAERWHVPPGASVIMLPGRITRIKGHLHLLRAIGRVNRPNFVCRFVGSIPPRASYSDEVEGLIGAMGLKDIVRMVGGCDDMPAAMLLADIVAVPSIGPEAFGRVAVEAQAMGKPVIVSDVGGLGETLMPAATGWVVPPGDERALTEALNLALDMAPDARARLAQRARRFVMRHFGADQMGRRTLAVYRELLGEAAAPAETEIFAVAAS